MVSELESRDFSSLGQICQKCIYDESIEGIRFDPRGVCNYCKMILDLKEEFATGEEEGVKRFGQIVSKIKSAGRRRKYDIIVGVSGGTDSSYMLWLAVHYGVRPLAVHYDNTFNTAIASQNIYRVTTALGVDLYTHVVDNRQSVDIFQSFFHAGVPELDGATDIALAEVLYRAAFKHRIRYVFEGHSFQEEGVAPMGKAYVDGRYIKDVHRRFGSVRIPTFPNMPLWRFLFWTLFVRIKKIRPLWFLKYSKSEAKKFLQSEFGWQDYQGHHLENSMTAFHHSIYTPQKFDLDQRNNVLAAQVRSGQKLRLEALAEFLRGPSYDEGLFRYVLNRLSISRSEYSKKVSEAPKSFRDYATYKRHFELLEPLFKVLARKSLVPKSFYLKYCFRESEKW